MITPAILAFTYAMATTPFLVWAFFKYNEFKERDEYFKQTDEEIVILQKSIGDLNRELNKMLNDINTIKLRTGLNGKESRH